ncbi:MAG: 16S rRNA (adenine(1518)-N(6)/adenine(1519)-N(6))-dimethyltransferase RsmA [Rhodospirillaceae bacterium]|nr:16S rRNA (adenine(1518)-N(6)/adenine(1519)-N(6))-dimethyltransferase RsmA [Rhodospirillaceae bacterium]
MPSFKSETDRDDPDPALPPLRDVIARHGLTARRTLGQHFLLDLNLTRRIARAAGDLAGRCVIEIGPGPGGLTRALLEAGPDRVIAIEKDRRAIAALEELHPVWPDRLEIIEADALALDVSRLGRAPRKIVANLPYNISTALLVAWLPQLTAFESLTLMFQKEVAERLVAAPGSRDYGRLSVATQWRAQVRRLFDIPARAFTPPPKVVSSVIAIEPRAEPLFPADPDCLERVVAAAFGQRRKMLRQALRTLGPDAESLLADAGIDPTARAETLSIEAFCALARAFAARGGPTAPRAKP